MSIYYTRKNIRKQCKKKLQIITLTWNDESELPDDFYSVSDIQDYIEYIIKKHETLTATPPIHVYINRIDNKLVRKIKIGYKLELKMSEAMTLLGSTK